MFTVSLAPKIANLCWWAKSRNDFGRSWVESQSKMKQSRSASVELQIMCICYFPCRLLCRSLKAMQFIKGGSSAWAHETFSPLRQFAWQSGYGAFSVSISHVPETISYIQNQVQHH